MPNNEESIILLIDYLVAFLDMKLTYAKTEPLIQSIRKPSSE